MKMLSAAVRNVRPAAFARAGGSGNRYFGEHFVPAEMPVVKRKWKAVESVGNICLTMKNVAAGKLPTCERFLAQARPFAASVMPFFQVEEAIDSSQIKKILHIVISPEKGLCGFVGSSTPRQAGKYVGMFPDQEHELTVFGKKGASRTRSMAAVAARAAGNTATVTNAYTDIKTKAPTFNMVLDAVSHIYAGERNFDMGYLHFNAYVNSTKYVLESVPFYNLEISKAIGEVQFPRYEIEGDEALIVENLMEFRTAAYVYLGLAENMASENGARLASMDGAQKACDERAVEYEKIYQGLRKSKITNELVVTAAGCKTIEAEKKRNA